MQGVDTQHLLNRLPADVRARLRGLLRRATFAPGEQIFAQGEPCTAIYLVVRGQVKVTRVTPDGKAVILCVRGPGDYLCPVSVLDGEAQLGTAVALTEVTLLWAERARFHALCEASPELLVAVQGDCLGEVRRLVGRLELVTFESTRARVALVLFTESARSQAGGGPPNEVRLTQQELAELVGASRETISRTLAQMEREGVVTLKRGRVLIRDRGALERLAGH